MCVCVEGREGRGERDDDDDNVIYNHKDAAQSRAQDPISDKDQLCIREIISSKKVYSMLL